MLNYHLKGGDTVGKSDKELAVEVAIAVINANQRIRYSKGNGVDSVTPSLNLDGVQNLIKNCYSAIKDLD